MTDRIYLDYNATTPLAPQVVAAMTTRAEMASHTFAMRGASIDCLEC